MKLDKAERRFMESYNADMMASIDHVSQNLGLNENGCTLKGFNVSEAFTKFGQYLEGYGEYKIKNVDNPEASSDKDIAESVTAFIETAVFTEQDLRYKDLPGFVAGYLTGVRSLTESVNRTKDALEDAGLDEASGCVNDFCDQFMEQMDARFTPAMDRILEASGYNNQVWIQSHLKGTRKPTQKVQFV